MKFIRSILLVSLFCCLHAAAQEQQDTLTLDTLTFDTLTFDTLQQPVRNTLSTRLQQAQQFLDKLARRRVDPNYIEVPEKPWRVILRARENAVDVTYDNSIEFPTLNERADWQMRFNPPVATAIGFWVGYRGTGISYSKSLIKNAGRYFSIGSTGARYGLQFRLRRFRTVDTTISASEYANGELVGKASGKAQTLSPVWIRSAYLNGYYVFNGRHYSQAAAYNQSVIQRRSAGSFLLGATWYQSSLDYSDKQNVVIMMLSRNIGRIKLQQASIGIGYGYNLVPFRGLVINAMVMPSISIYNRVKVYKYDFNYDLTSPPADDYGSWNPQTRTWANGRSYQPVPEDDEEYKWIESVDSWQTGSETEYSALRLSLDVRVGIAYNWKNYFLAAQLQLNQYYYKKDKSEVRFTDGFAQASLGVRF